MTFKNSKFWTTHFYNCRNVRVRDCAIRAEILEGVKGPSTDAIDIDRCQGFVVSNVVMDVNDDAVVIKGGKGPWANDPSRHPENGPSVGVEVVDSVFGRSCHSCLTLGSECPAASNVVVRNCRVEGAGNLLCLKMRTDTPQRFSDIRVEGCVGSCGTVLRVPAWRQFANLGDRTPADVFSRATGVTFVRNALACRQVARKDAADGIYELSNVTFDGNRFETPDMMKAAAFVRPARTFDVRDYPSVADAVAACRAAGGGRIAVTKGVWRTGPVHLASNCELHVAAGAELVFSDDPKACLPAVRVAYEGVECFNYSPLVYAYGVVTQNEAFLFIHPNRLSIEQTAEFEKNGVQIREYDAFLPFIDAMAKQKSDAAEEICFDASDVSFAVFSRLEGRNPDTTFKYSIEFA